MDTAAEHAPLLAHLWAATSLTAAAVPTLSATLAYARLMRRGSATRRRRATHMRSESGRGHRAAYNDVGAAAGVGMDASARRKARSGKWTRARGGGEEAGGPGKRRP